MLNNIPTLQITNNVSGSGSIITSYDPVVRWNRETQTTNFQDGENTIRSSWTRLTSYNLPPDPTATPTKTPSKTPTMTPTPTPSPTATPASREWTYAIEPGINLLGHGVDGVGDFSLAAVMALANQADVQPSMVSVYDDGWLSLVEGLPSRDRLIPIGAGFLLQARAAGTMTLSGGVPQNPTWSLQAGWNFVCFSEAQPGDTASTMIVELIAAGAVNPTLARNVGGGWEIYQPTLGNDFPIQLWRGYFAYTTEVATPAR
jgi:hypothetical protein